MCDILLKIEKFVENINSIILRTSNDRSFFSFYYTFSFNLKKNIRDQDWKI